MGVVYEINWYLVVDSKESITKMNELTYQTEKSEYRIYPIDVPIPLIIKKVGCVGLVDITSFKVDNNKTLIEFKYFKELDLGDKISQHYYDMYIHMKNR